MTATETETHENDVPTPDDLLALDPEDEVMIHLADENEPITATVDDPQHPNVGGRDGSGQVTRFFRTPDGPRAITAYHEDKNPERKAERAVYETPSVHAHDRREVESMHRVETDGGRPPSTAGYPSPEWHHSRAALRGVVNETVADSDATRAVLDTLVRESRMVRGERVVTDGGHDAPDETPRFAVGQAVEDRDDDGDATMRVLDSNAGRADEVEVGTTGATVAEFTGNEVYPDDDRVVNVVFESDLGAVDGWDDDPATLPETLRQAREAFDVFVPTYDYPESRLRAAEDDATPRGVADDTRHVDLRNVESVEAPDLPGRGEGDDDDPEAETDGGRVEWTRGERIRARRALSNHLPTAPHGCLDSFDAWGQIRAEVAGSILLAAGHDLAALGRESDERDAVRPSSGSARPLADGGERADENEVSEQ